MSDTTQPLSQCGCCSGVTTVTPVSVANLPGLPALVYRVGTFGGFKESMEAHLSGQAGLRELTTRDDDDPAIALIDGWATVLDVLSFYQERIADEGYLRTATERSSILEMARSIGYELRPGVAAGTFLAFTLESAQGAPLSARIPAGTKAQSTPGQDETPQTFETTKEIQAFAAWNELKLRPTQFVVPFTGMTTLYLKGTSTNLKPGDPLLVIGDERLKDPGNENWDFRRVAAVQVVAVTDPDASYTVVTLNAGLGSASPPVHPAQKNPKVYALRQPAGLFGAVAPDWRAMPNSLKAGYLGFDPGAANLNDLLKPFTEWPGFTIADISDPPPAGTVGAGLHGEYYNTQDFKERKLSRTDATVNFDFGSGSPHPSIDAFTFSIRWTGWVQAKLSEPTTFFVKSDDGARLWVDGKLIIDHWSDHDATKEDASTSQILMQAGQKYDIRLDYYQNLGAASVILSWSSANLAKEVIPQSQLFPRDVQDIHLDALYPKIQAGSWVVLAVPGKREVFQVTKAAEDARSNFTINAKTANLTLQGEHLREFFDDRIRDTVVYAQSEELPWAEQPITTPVAQAEIELSQKVDGLSVGQPLAVSGALSSTGAAAAEIAVLAGTTVAGGRTKLLLQQALINSYRRDSVVIQANVAPATHGETKQEVLGAGDGSQAFQKFVLKQKPLTYVAAETASGAETTLAVRVNDVLWSEAPNFYRRTPADKVYITRLADDGAVTVEFGDGTTGARPATGAENITAVYRTGIGLKGMLQAGQINLLMSRPLGVKAVANPLAPSGGQDPEHLSQARQNAPLTVLTLDRIVSLQDFEDFARAFAGIGKSQATWLWDGEKRLVHLTVAGVNGVAVPQNSDIYTKLLAAIDLARHTDEVVRVANFAAKTFDLEMKLLIDLAYRFDDVQSAVKQALLDGFSFAARSFGQAVTASEVIAAAQGVAGVMAVDLVKFYFHGAAASLQPRLAANVAQWAGSQINPAELLTINAAGIKLTEMTQ